MKTVEEEFFRYEEEKEIVVTLPITTCESVEDILNLDATVDEERLQRATTAKFRFDMIDDGFWAEALNEDPENTLRPEEVVFLDENRMFLFVKGSGMCYGLEACCIEDHIPYLYLDSWMNQGSFYADKNNEFWVKGNIALEPVGNNGCVLMPGDPFIDDHMRDALYFHRSDTVAPDSYGRWFGFSLAQYQHMLCEHAPFTLIDVQYQLPDSDEWQTVPRFF